MLAPTVVYPTCMINRNFPSCIFQYLRMGLALFHRLWYNVRSHKTRRLFMKQFAAQFYFGYYYFFMRKK